MKLLPIEPGCLVVVTKAHIGWEKYIGTCSKVIRKYPFGNTCKACGNNNRKWEMEYFYHCECGLMRIDGGDFSKERESEKVREKA